MKISIIIPCYNIASHLPKCIESVLNQTYSDFELLLINDGSTDGTLKVCEEYRKKDTRIKVYSHHNRGASYSRNKAMEVACGEYIMFVDGDDWIEKEMLAVLVEDSNNTTVMNICGMINEKSSQVTKNPFYEKLLESKEDLIQKDSFITLVENYQMSSPCCKLYHKSIITDNKIRFDEKISYQEDIIFNLKYFKYIEAVKLRPFYGYHYIQHVVSSSSRYHKYFDHINNLMLQLRHYSRNQHDEKVTRVFVFDTILKAMSNIAHKNAPLRNREKIMELQKILVSDEFNYCQGEIKKSSLNALLKTLLLYKNAYFVNVYYSLKKYLD